MGVGENKRKKHHDKDKYYRLAKEQGLRSRAAFKLSQINRKFPILEQCTTAVLDLCAAPGGWTQIAARTCPSSTAIIAVDILPIRSIGRSHPNVTTLVGDITTDKCKAEITRTLQSHGVESKTVNVVLHDGAPNIGAEYGKDAYEQNELTLHALKCATQHLCAGGTFVTKIYRSKDYASVGWVLRQLFDSVQAFKPKASRAQSAEIFMVCEGYKAPAKLDPRYLDPKYVFETVEGETTGGVLDGNTAAVTVFHKKFDKKKHRGGYDMDFLDATMRHIEPVGTFVQASTVTEAIRLLSTSTGFAFSCQVCRTEKEENDVDTDICNCQYLLHHPLTTSDLKESLADLKVLNRSDFKSLLNWRMKMQEAIKANAESESDNEEEARGPQGDASEEESDSEKEEEEIQAEIAEVRQRRMRERKRLKKKERAVAAKRRRQAALGMDLNAIDVPDHDKIFSLASITSKGDLEAAREVNLDQMNDEEIFGGDSDDDIVIGHDEEAADGNDTDDEDERERRRERDLEDAYNQYLESTKNGLAKSGTKMAKRSKKLQRIKVAEEAAEDQEMALTESGGIQSDMKAYVKQLQGPQDSDDESSDEEEDGSDNDDGFHEDPMTPEEHAAKKAAKRRKLSDGKDENPLIHKFAEESASVKTARWFSNPLFASIGQTAKAAAAAKAPDVPSDEVESESESDEKKPSKKGLSADEVLALMPRTDKQIRHERRLKKMARDERKKARQARKLGESEADFELAPGEDDEEEADVSMDHLSEPEKKRISAARDLIKAGMGSNLKEDKSNSKGIEVVPEEDHDDGRPLPVMDRRKYDSENEDYDSDDYAQTLALGTMMLRKSKEKALVDASYNRYAWNDPNDLPDWFVDDENKHYRPQLPIPPALLAKMREKMIALSTKPIAKVAEARARKSKRAKAKLASAKKQAEAVANSTEMSEAMKLKAISKALRGQEAKKPGKTYVVAKKGRGEKGAKGVKVVDKRMKSDKRGLERAMKKRTNGKGSKKRRGRS